MKKIFATLVLAVIVAGVGVGNVQADTIYTSEAAFNAATVGQVVTTFDGNAPAQDTFYGSSYTGANFSISDSSGLLFTVDPAYYPPFYQWNSGGVLDFQFGIGTITVAPSVTAFGFDFGNPTGLDSTTGSISVDGNQYVELGQPNFNFFGIVGSAPLGPVTINYNGGLGILDNFTTASVLATPEPASITLLVSGFFAAGGFGLYRRRRAATAS